MPGDDARLVAVSRLQQGGVVGHHEAALILGRLMTPLAVLLKNRADLAVIADAFRLFILGGFIAARRRTAERSHQDQAENSHKLAPDQRHEHNHSFRKARSSSKEPHSRPAALEAGFLGRFILADWLTSFKEFFLPRLVQSQGSGISLLMVLPLSP